jgi:hypothetical protein
MRVKRRHCLSGWIVGWLLLLSAAFLMAAEDSNREKVQQSDQDTGFLVVNYDPEIEQALQISKTDILRNRRVKNGVIGFAPGGGYNGIWLTDSTFLLAGYRYWGPEYRNFLYSDEPEALGLVPRFAAAQDTDGLIPMAITGDEGRIEYGGRWDLAQHKQNRDMESPYTFVHVNYMYWRDTADLTYARRYRTSLRRALEPIDHRRDAATGLILGTYGPPNSDACVDYAVPQTTAEPYFNALYVRAYFEYADLAEAVGDAAEARVYRHKADGLRQAINRYAWVAARIRYEMRILRTPVSTDPNLPATLIKEDTRFPLVDNMLMIYYGIPDSREKIEALVHQIDESEKGLAVEGRMVVPPYPDGFITRARKMFDSATYHNGDVWTWFSNQYATALYRLGLPASADHVLRSQAHVVIRDQGFSEYYAHDEKGAAKGSFHYGPTAATFESAIVEGLFGLELDAPRHSLSVHPSLSRSGELRVRLGGKPTEVSLDIQPDRSEILLRLETGLTVHGNFRVLVPEAFTAGGKWTVSQQSAGKSLPIPCALAFLGNGAYVRFEADLAPGAQQFRLRQVKASSSRGHAAESTVPQTSQ